MSGSWLMILNGAATATRWDSILLLQPHSGHFQISRWISFLQHKKISLTQRNIAFCCCRKHIFSQPFVSSKTKNFTTPLLLKGHLEANIICLTNFLIKPFVVAGAVIVNKNCKIRSLQAFDKRYFTLSLYASPRQHTTQMGIRFEISTFDATERIYYSNGIRI